MHNGRSYSITSNSMQMDQRRSTKQKRRNLAEIEELDKYSSQGDSSQDDYQKKLDMRIKAEKVIIKKDYEKRMQ